ncbi:MAG: VTT domain-containing protein [Candidatus Moranbacteria bacterium]|nr:VTT domain-containing protein [Candidatus Moranbacteria bacterium]
MVPPSEYICIAAGILLSTKGDYNLNLIIIIATLSNLLGTLPWYFLGKRHKTRNKSLTKKTFSKWLIINKIINIYTKDLQHIERLYETNGFLLVSILRNVPVIRSICSYPAGRIGMDFTRFVTYSFVGILAWVTIWSCAGKFIGYTIINYNMYISLSFGVISFLILKLTINLLRNKAI